MAVIEINHLKKYFRDVKAVDDISLCVEEGEIFGYLGPNGAGKSTTIATIMGFLNPTAGTISILNKDATAQRAELKKDIGYLSSDVHLYQNLSGKEHLQLVESVRGKSSSLVKLLQDFPFNINQPVHHLSTGTRQKLGVIMCLMSQPRILILDEPTRGLDPLLQNVFYRYLVEMKKKGTTIFMSSHNLSEVDKLCDYIGILKEGKLQAVETISSLKDKRIHDVKAVTLTPIVQNDFPLGEFDAVDFPNPYELHAKIKGQIDPIIKKLNKYELVDLEIKPASLEDIFMEYYR